MKEKQKNHYERYGGKTAFMTYWRYFPPEMRPGHYIRNVEARMKIGKVTSEIMSLWLIFLGIITLYCCIFIDWFERRFKK